ncbi:MAG: hypothetical protein D6820_16620, partial [Lentisphaerae bacterium]
CIFHPDQKGADLEVAIPLPLLSNESRAKLRAGMRIPFTCGYLDSKNRVAGKVWLDILNKRSSRYKWPYAWIIPFTPQYPLPVAGKKNKKQQILFTVKPPSKKQGPSVVWDHEYYPYRSAVRQVNLYRQKENIVIDGKLSEWSLNEGNPASPYLFMNNATIAWFFAATNRKRLILAAEIPDVTPMGRGDFCRFFIDTGKIHKIEFQPVQAKVLVDGKEEESVQWKSHLYDDYQHYSLELAVPFNLLGVSSEADLTGRGRVSVQLGFNKYWQFVDLVSHSPALWDATQPATWARFFPRETPPPCVITQLIDHSVMPAFAASTSNLQLPRWKNQRSPFETWIRSLQILPGTATVDGKPSPGEWDMRAGVWSSPDARWLGRYCSTWIYAMYDADNLYFLARVKDASPMEHTRAYNIWSDDLFQVRITMGEHVTHLSPCWWNDRQKWELNRQLGLPPRNAKLPPDHGIKVAFQRYPDGSGYDFELAYPWKLIVPEGTPAPKAGTKFPITLMVKMGPQAETA